MRLAERTVRLPVWGIREIIKDESPLFATVRLTPSTATEPFSRIYFIYFSSAENVRLRAIPSFSEERIRPVKSTCPSTICPPRRSQKRSARSKFTGVPAANREKAVRRIVSGVTSQENVLPSKAVTVRQVPLTAILSPAFVPSSTLWQAIVSRQELPVRSTFLICPISSTSPVNMATPVLPAVWLPVLQPFFLLLSPFLQVPLFPPAFFPVPDPLFHFQQQCFLSSRRYPL